MSYLLSKIFWLAVQPLSLTLILLVLAILFGAFGWSRGRSFLSIAAALLLSATLFTTAGTVLLQSLEQRIARADLAGAPPDCIIVLGGSFEAEVIAARGGIEMNQAGDRFVEALRLARQYPAAKILVSGGDGSFSGDYEGDADVSERFFRTFGIPSERLIKEKTSRTTFENVANTRALLTGNGLGNCLLVTSAFHMPRAVGLFRKADIAVRPWPTDFRTSGKARLGFDFTQPSSNAQLTTTALREYTGLLAYYLAGRTFSLLPE